MKANEGANGKRHGCLLRLSVVSSIILQHPFSLLRFKTRLLGIATRSTQEIPEFDSLGYMDKMAVVM